MPRLPQIKPVLRAGRVKGHPWCVDPSAKLMEQLSDGELARRDAQYFETKAAAEDHCKDLRARLASFDDASRKMTGERRLEAHRCFLVCDAHGFTLTDAVEQMRVRTIAQDRSILIPKLVEIVIADKQAKGKSEKYQYDAANRFRRFARDHQEVKASQLTTESLDEWLDTLNVGPTSRNNYRRHLKLLLNYALRKEWVIKNVANGLEKAKESTNEVEALTTDECRRLLDRAGRRELPVLAIGLFAGIRPYEIMRMHWSQIHWPEGERPGDIDVLAKQAKTAQRRIVPIRPNFAAWLEHYRGMTGIIYPEGIWHWYRQLSALRAAAKVDRWPHDATRHTFCSMDLAHFNDANALALRMGHTDTQLIFTRYRRVVKAEEAARFWNLYPEQKP